MPALCQYAWYDGIKVNYRKIYVPYHTGPSTRQHKKYDFTQITQTKNSYTISGFKARLMHTVLTCILPYVQSTTHEYNNRTFIGRKKIVVYQHKVIARPGI